MIENINVKRQTIDFGRDSIVVRKFINGVLGGRMLDCTGYKNPTILSGQCIITDGNGSYKPMPINGETYGEMPEGFSYCGVAYRSVKVSEPVSIMFRGIVNKQAAPYYFKSDFNMPDIIFSADLDDTDPFQGYAVVLDPAELASKGGEDIRVTSAEVVNGFTSEMPYFRNIAVANAEVDKTITMKATEKIILDGIILAGGKDGANGKITYAAKELQLKNITAKENATLYNAFEGYQRTNDPSYNGLEKLTAENLDIDCPSLTHNIINVYTPANGAEIVVKDSKFNITVDNTNPLRMANYLNAENVTITFENCDWTYENGVTKNDWRWAGLVIYQPAATDIALGGDTSKVATWTYKFKNCRYNGEKVAANNFGEHNQVVYFYNVGNTNNVTEPVGNIVFE